MRDSRLVFSRIPLRQTDFSGAIIGTLGTM
jgi:hypothetical protein